MNTYCTLPSLAHRDLCALSDVFRTFSFSMHAHSCVVTQFRLVSIRLTVLALCVAAFRTAQTGDFIGLAVRRQDKVFRRPTLNLTQRNAPPEVVAGKPGFPQLRQALEL